MSDSQNKVEKKKGKTLVSLNNRSYDMLATFSCLNRSFRVTCLLTGSCSCLENLTR
ncbi:hypothetical protein HanRHA438_Chr04g0160631 [Helianthus annuus]|nr:hypothetical protein HanRHA438_Chr04g0160631 [Helianthus annuus]